MLWFFDIHLSVKFTNINWIYYSLQLTFDLQLALILKHLWWAEALIRLQGMQRHLLVVILGSSPRLNVLLIHLVDQLVVGGSHKFILHCTLLKLVRTL